MEIVVLDSYAVAEGDLDWAPLYELAQTVTLWPRTPYEQIAARIGGAEMAIANKSRIDEAVLAACPSLKWVGLTATGTDSLDLAACTRHGVKVANVPGYSTESVAQHTFALLLELANQAGQRSRSVQEGWWQTGVPQSYGIRPHRELAGKTFGVVGFGAIGQAAARIAQGFGMEVLVHTRTQRPAQNGLRFVSLDELLAQSDVVSLHCPATPGTVGLMGPAQLAAMRPGAMLLNTARGALVDAAAVAEACRAGHILYGADVVLGEPIEQTNPLFGAPGVLITPHVAWATREALGRLGAQVCKNARAYLNGEARNLVN